MLQKFGEFQWSRRGRGSPFLKMGEKVGIRVLEGKNAEKRQIKVDDVKRGSKGVIAVNWKTVRTGSRRRGTGGNG